MTTRGIDTTVRLWCKNCQVATKSENCPDCATPGMACAVCHTCAIHGKAIW